MERNVFTSDFKDIIFQYFDYAFIHELYDCSDVRSLRVQVDYMVTEDVRPYLRVQLRMFNENGAPIRRGAETDIPASRHPHMTHSSKPLVGLLSVRKLLQQRSKFKIDSHPNKPIEVKMNQGITRRIQASTNPEDNFQYKKPDNIRVTKTIQVNEGQTRLEMSKGHNRVAVVDTANTGKTITMSFDLLEAFYHAVKGG